MKVLQILRDEGININDEMFKPSTQMEVSMLEKDNNVLAQS